MANDYYLGEHHEDKEPEYESKRFEKYLTEIKKIKDRTHQDNYATLMRIENHRDSISPLDDEFGY